MPNPIRFTPVEPMPPRSLRLLPSVMHMGVSPTNYEAALIRLLTGTLDIKCNFNNEIIKQRINYSQLPPIKNQRLTSGIIKQSVQPHKMVDISKALSKSINHNNIFYKELFFESSNYFLRKKQKNEIAAFVHVYRILESIAYTFPLIWASKANNYVGTFVQLRKYFNGEKTGELRMFERFIDDVIPGPLLNVQTSLHINSVHPDWQEKYYQSIYKNIDQADIISYTQFSDITVKTHCFISLIINLRNQYFHFLSGNGNNFGSEDVFEANEFFHILNEELIHWLSIIFFEILDFEMS